MNSFWTSLYDSVKDRRYGRLFFFTLAGVFGLLVLFGGLLKTSLRDSVINALPVTAVFVMVWFAVTLWRAFTHRYEESKYPRLSSDEVAKARSKLLKHRNRESL